MARTGRMDMVEDELHSPTNHEWARRWARMGNGESDGSCCRRFFLHIIWTRRGRLCALLEGSAMAYDSVDARVQRHIIWQLRIAHAPWKSLLVIAVQRKPPVECPIFTPLRLVSLTGPNRMIVEAFPNLRKRNAQIITSLEGKKKIKNTIRKEKQATRAHRKETNEDKQKKQWVDLHRQASRF